MVFPFLAIGNQSHSNLLFAFHSGQKLLGGKTILGLGKHRVQPKHLVKAYSIKTEEREIESLKSWINSSFAFEWDKKRKKKKKKNCTEIDSKEAFFFLAQNKEAFRFYIKAHPFITLDLKHLSLSLSLSLCDPDFPLDQISRAQIQVPQLCSFIHIWVL